MIEIPAKKTATPNGEAIEPAAPLPTVGIELIVCDGNVYRCYEAGDQLPA